MYRCRSVQASRAAGLMAATSGQAKAPAQARGGASCVILTSHLLDIMMLS